MLSSRGAGGIGVITGTASGNVEMLELEGPTEQCDTRLKLVRDLAGELGHQDLLERVLTGCCERSAGGGLHIFLRIAGECRPNTQLAHLSVDGVRKIAAETRGQGGFVVTWPTTARLGQPDGSRYELLPGTYPCNVATVTEAERDLLYSIVTAALDEPAEDVPLKTPSKLSFQSVPSPTSPTSPWVAFASTTTWARLLEPEGWTFLRTDAAGRSHWTRPGKTPAEGTSATSLEDGPLYVFSTSTTLPTGQGMSKAFVFAHLKYGGDFTAATQAMRAHGYGDSPEEPDALADADVISTPVVGEPLDYEEAVQRRLVGLRITDDAKRRFAAERSANAPALEGVRLGDFLAQPDDEARYRINRLWPTQGRVLLAAAAKSGKTTMVVANLLPALVDGEPFLGEHEAERVTGTVVFLNLEVSESVIRAWLRGADIDHVEQVLVANLRGQSSALSLDSDAGRSRFATWLRDQGAQIVILDPLAPLLAGLNIDENSNSDVARFFSWWTEALTEAGVHEDLIVHHTGHGGQRSRGASRLLDEPDAIWTLTKDRDTEQDGEFAPLTATRHLAAYGRDVELPPTTLAFDETTRRLTATGHSPKAARAAATSAAQRQRIIDYLEQHEGANTRRISSDAGIQKAMVTTLLRELVADGTIDYTQVGQERNYTLTQPSPVPQSWGWGTGDGPLDTATPLRAS